MVIQASSSEIQPAGDRGAPQGSVLGGILYKINSKELPMGREGDATEFVDDHADQNSGETVDTAVDNLQKDADKTSHWLEVNGMVILQDKSKLIILKSKFVP